MRFCYSFVLAGLFAATTTYTVSGEEVNVATLDSTLVYKTIKAYNNPTEDKDSWKVAGEQAVDERVPLQAVVDCGFTLELSDDSGLLDTLAVKCELRGTKDNAIACSADGARYSIKRIASPKLIDEDDLPTIGVDVGYNFYAVSGTFKRREFKEDTLKGPLTVKLISCVNNFVQTTNDDCVVKGKSQLSATCKP